jgi:hypothetical protein
MTSQNNSSPQKFKIVESVPDKNGVIIIAIKPDENGTFNSREEALDHLYRTRRGIKNAGNN